jgi:hypothetical protein
VTLIQASSSSSNLAFHRHRYLTTVNGYGDVSLWLGEFQLLAFLDNHVSSSNFKVPHPEKLRMELEERERSELLAYNLNGISHRHYTCSASRGALDTFSMNLHDRTYSS